MIAVLDYGLGNIKAFLNVYKQLNMPAEAVISEERLRNASHIILPGVGAFDYAMERLDASGLRGALEQAVLEESRPVLGVCVGMQIMARRSDEGGRAGLGWLDAEVREFKLPSAGNRFPLPHMGWNEVHPKDDSGLFSGLGCGSNFYFLHSFYFSPKDSVDIVANGEYGITFAAAVKRKNIYGVQFHPEKSHGWGMKLLKNFAGL